MDSFQTKFTRFQVTEIQFVDNLIVVFYTETTAIKFFIYVPAVFCKYGLASLFFSILFLHLTTTLIYYPFISPRNCEI